MKWFNDIVTGIDGVTHDIGRWSWIGSMAGIFTLAVHEVWTGKTIDFAALGTGIAAVVAAHGAALWAKKDSEPKS